MRRITPQDICLCMIVKNEAAVIERCLDSVRPLVNSWLIVDTGSTDGTQGVIRECMKDLPGELIERPWRDFAHNRTEALELAKGRGEYVFVIDADETLEVDEGCTLPPLDRDGYSMEIRYGASRYSRRQLLKNSLRWAYRGVLHEYVHCEQAATWGEFKGLRTIPHCDGARAKDPEKYAKDAAVLEAALRDEPHNERYVFYLAQSYRDAGNLPAAIDNYRKRAAMAGWGEEVWYSLYQVAVLEERLGAPWGKVMADYLQAFQCCPLRPEPLYRVGMHYQAKGEYHNAYLFLKQAASLSAPGGASLFVEWEVCERLLPIQYAVACYYVGDHAEAMRVSDELLGRGSLPPALQDLVMRNRAYSEKAIALGRS